MPSLMSMEDLFYGPPEATWILPTRDDRPYYREREFTPPRRFHHSPDPIRPVERYHQARRLDHDIRPVMRAPPRGPPMMESELRPVERLARVHTVPEPVPVRAGHEEIRKVVEGPVVPTAVPPPTQVVTAAPVVPVPAPPPPVQVVQKRSVSPPRAIVHHPIELKVPMCCEKCVRKVRERLQSIEGVESVITDQYNQKVIVHGRADPSRVLHSVKLVKKRSVFWDITVDYSERYRHARQLEDAAIAREQSKAATAKAEAVQAAKAVVTPASSQVVVNLPQDHHGPRVTAILPERNPAAGFRPEFVHHPARMEPMMRPHPELHHRRHSEVY